MKNKNYTYPSFMFLLLFLFCVKKEHAQVQSTPKKDTTSKHIPNGDFGRENVTKNKNWGNSWHASLGVHLLSAKEIDLSFGRTYAHTFAGCVMYTITTRNYGMGMSLINNKSSMNFAPKIYWEYCFTNIPIPPFALRAEALYNINNNNLFTRFSLGGSFIYADILYTYSVGAKHTYTRNHGLAIRFKYITNRKKWEHANAGK